MKIYFKYFVKEFMNAFSFSVASFLIIRLAVEIFENLNMLIEHHVSFRTAVSYFACISPYFLVQLLPIATLMATLYTLTKMAKTQEITACRAAGLSNFKLALPFLTCAITISLLNFVLDETIVPPANTRARVIKQEEILKTQYAPGIYKEHLTFKTTDGLVVYAGAFDGSQGLMSRVSVVELRARTHVVARWDAERAAYDPSGWKLLNGIHRTFLDDGSETAESFATLTFPTIDPPAEFSKPMKRLEELNIVQSWQYLERLKRWGANPAYELVYFYLKFSFPFANVILCLIGIPIAFLTGARMGVIFSFSLSVIVGFIYWMTLGIGVSLGKNAALPPLASAWMGNLIFGTIGGALMYYTTWGQMNRRRVGRWFSWQ